MHVDDEYFSLIFKGGTSLSKSYQVIERLSEDIDFQITQKPITDKLGKGVRRKKLRDFRYGLVNSLKNANFNAPEERVKVFYEGRFMSIRAEFNRAQLLLWRAKI
ncbi:MAG: nucleotidyl transferase AbiEii/AbiGii toxin family protein [Gammaproteobacteria bacterium]|nr:nucleotidyl transferase AbiEii/AbiGii toxin family protein [Gammaproteobacteria bacterium]